MSGHSHSKTILHKKQITDKKRGQIFSKLSRLISVASKKGGDPDMNPELRMAVEQAKKANMPQANIERAIKRGTGELEGEALEEFCFEAYGPACNAMRSIAGRPAKSAIIITGITSNKNRALNEIKQILNQNNAKLAEEGSVKWQFENMGVIIINPVRDSGDEEYPQNKHISNGVNPEGEEKEKIEMAVIEAGAEDMRWEGEFLEIYTKPDKLEQVKKELETKELRIESAAFGWMAKEEISINEKEMTAVEKLFTALDENDDVQEVYSNVKL